MVVTGYMLILLALLTRVGCHDREYDTYSNMMENRMKDFGHNELMGLLGIGSLQQCLNSERKSTVALMDPTIPLNLDDGSGLSKNVSKALQMNHYFLCCKGVITVLLPSTMTGISEEVNSYH